VKAELVAVFGDDNMVCDAARVSMDKRADQYLPEQNERLIKYLVKNDHWSPLSHPKAQFRLSLPIFVARQWEKHRVGVVRGYDIFDQNEISRRYVDSAPDFFEPDTWRARPEESIKQGSGEALDVRVQYKCQQTYKNAIHACEKAYEALLAWDVAPEQARMVLPQSMMTQWVETGSLSYWARLCNLRLDSHAQKEIGVLSQQVSEQMAKVFPVSWRALVC